MSVANTKTTVGAALVAGGGIGGMQAALDLAEAGIKVYLVEAKPSIGGVMARLDKTFPTNDCAMCTMAPRLVDIGRHKDIDIITLAEVDRIAGEAGNFTVTLNKKARYVDESKCTGCGLCISACPVVLKNEFDLGMSERKAIYTLFPQAVPNKPAIDRREERPCKAACMYRCPVHTNVLGYVKLIAQGKFREAYRMNRDVNPFPSVCGRVCYAPCETACNRGQLDEPVAIRQLKMFVADQVNLDELPVPTIAKTGKKVAVIGAGPAGLAAANDLALQGHQVTVFEAQPEAGGMLRYGIPEYRLPRETLRKEIGYIGKLGVEIRTGVRVGTEIPVAAIRQEYAATFIAVGAQAGMNLELEGAGLAGVVDGIRFLQAVNVGEKVQVGKRVAVVGGGNTAIDCARTAKRLGAEEVTMVYRRSRAEMPAAKEEIEAMEQEGIKIAWLSLPTRFLGGDGRLAAMQCIAMALGEPDASGRRRPIPVPGSEFTTVVDTAILAIGQLTQIDFLKALGISVNPNGTVAIDRKTGATNLEGWFAGGDVVTGAAYVIDAIAAGKKAARSIGQYLSGMPIEAPPEEKEPEKLSDEEVAALKRRFLSSKRAEMRELPVAERIGNFREVALGFEPEQAVREAMRCLAGQVDGCIECLECVRHCDAGAIDLHQKEAKIELNVGAVILAPGYESYDPRGKPQLGYGRYRNVITAPEFERILSASGPFQGKVVRPSDQKTPRRIAFIQCVGSRERERDYCSAVCCMYATKEALIAKEHIGEDLECDIFFMDLRAYGKGFEAYYERAKTQGVNYIRCRPPVVEEAGESGNLTIQYLTEGDRKTSREYDLVVLSTGLLPPKSSSRLAEGLGIELNEFNFCRTSAFTPAQTSREGVYVAGPFAEPKDIPETVMQASAAAAKALSLLRDAKGSLIVAKEYPPEIDVSGQAPRIGVFVCHCGTNIAGVVDVGGVAEYAKTLAGVVCAEDNMYACSNDTQERIKQQIREHGLNRVIVASCSPRTHESLFRNTCREAGLNGYLFEMANIRDQCSWVHMQEPEKATHKAMDLLRMAAAKARLIEPLQKRRLAVQRGALVIGAGLAGMVAATELSSQGFNVYLVERERELGGSLRRVQYLLNRENPRQELLALIERILRDDRIHLFTESSVTSMEGSLGNFKSVISTGGGDVTVEHGAIVVATGAGQYEPKEYLYGACPEVITQLDLEERLSRPGAPAIAGTTVMIQCVGSRDKERPYCSRVCCTEAIKNAIKIKETNPAANVYVLYRDIRTYGFREAYYSKARELGVVFLRYEEDRKPEVTRNGERLEVAVYSPLMEREIAIPADLVVLSAGIVPDRDSKQVAQLLKVPLNSDGFFLEAHMKLRPVDFATDGVFVCGLAHAPKSIEETIIQAQAAAARASAILSKDYVELEATVSHVDEDRCDGCAYCVDPCPFKAIRLVEYQWNGATKKRVQVDEAVCKGCGTCQATCPKNAIFVWHFRPEQLTAQIHAALNV
ncbi:MAG: NAD(P)-binding protein [Bryobacteraceae bacterium]|jgi:heterodisulfide reductase subunit A-like polyferredoxin